MRDAIRRHPLAAFCPLAFALSWAAAAPFALRSRGVLTFEDAPLLESLVAFGPAVAALIVLSIAEGRQGVAGLWRSICDWRIGWLSFFMAAIVPLLLLGLGLLVARLVSGAPLEPRAGVAFGAFPWIVALLAAALSGPGEEPGWRGFALRRLQVSGSALRAALLVAVIWWAWHLPMFLYRVDVSLVQSLLFFVGLVAGSVWVSCAYNAAGGSTFAAILWHSMWNIASTTGRAFPLLVFLTMTTGVMLLAVLILVLWGPARLAPGLRAGRSDTP